MKTLLLIGSSLTLIGCTGMETYEPLPVQLTEVTPCKEKWDAGAFVGNCTFVGITETRQPIQGSVFTMGEVGDWVHCTVIPGTSADLKPQ